MRKTLILLFLLLQVALSYGQKREFRGAWIQCVNGQFNGLTPDEMRSTLTKQLDVLHADGVNAIIFQVRAECDALYASKYEPWSRFLTGTLCQQIRALEPLPHGCAGQSTQSLLGSTAMDDRTMP